MRRTLLIALTALVVACSPSDEQLVERGEQDGPLVWPAPPAQARIKYLYSFREPRHLGIRAPVFERLWEAVVGEEVREMVRPYAVAVDGARIAVTDPGLAVVHVFDRETGTYRRLAQAGEERLRSPVGVAFGADFMFVSDSALGKIFAFDHEAKLAQTLGDLERPTGLAFDGRSGRLYAADTLGHRIAVFDASGRPISSFGRRGAEPGEFNFPTHLALRDGRLYINDTMNFRVQTFDLEGNWTAAFGRHGDGSGDFARPKGLGVDPAGHIYVADALFDRVQIFDSGGRFLLAFGGSGDRPGQFWLPGGVFIEEDKIYVVDTYNRRVQVYQLLGEG